MKTRLLPIDEILRLLGAGPTRIEMATMQYTDEELARQPSQDAWSANDILAHLRTCQDVWGDVRVIRMLKEDHPTMRAVNPRSWQEQTNYGLLPFSASLAEFAAQRVRFLEIVRSASLDDWARGGTFTGGGSPRQYTVHTEMDALARHERSHIKQIERLCRST